MNLKQTVWTGLQRPGTWAMGLETGALALVTAALGVWVGPGDPLFSASAFAWCTLAPLLSGLRYGFASGLACALLLIAAQAAWQRAFLAPGTAFPGEVAFGLLVVGMLAGEFRDVWERKLGRSRAEGDYHKRRLEEFSRVYHVLRASHERLEERAARGGGSLRQVLTGLRESVQKVEPGEQQLQAVGEALLRLTASHCGVQAASLLALDPSGALGGSPVATLGDVEPLDPADPLLARALASAEVAVRKGTSQEGLLAAVPLLDVEGRVYGVLAVRRMHFPAIHPETFRTLAVIGTHVGDILAHAPGFDGNPGTRLRRALQRSLEDVAHHGLAASLVTVASEDLHARPVLQQLAAQRRGLDEAWVTRDARERPVLMLLLPLTDAEGAVRCRTRLEQLLPALAGEAVPAASFTFATELLTRDDRVESVLERTLGRSHVEDDETAVGDVRPAGRAAELGHSALG